MNFQSPVRLTFFAMVGRGELDLPVVKQVLPRRQPAAHANPRRGHAAKPGARQEALPALNHLNQALQQLRSELENRK